MKAMCVSALSLSLSAFSAASMAAEPAQCAKFLSAIEQSEKSMSADMAKGVTDNSAPRATVRALESIQSILLIQLNLNLAVQNHCTQVPASPVVAGAYLVSALKCESELLQARARGGIEPTLPASCDTTKWVRIDAGKAP